MRSLPHVVFVALVVGLTGCGGSDGGGITLPPPPAAPTVSCPASVSMPAPDNIPTAVTYTVPTASGGQDPVRVTCLPASGAAFPLGSSVVTCTATDALARLATCNFNVTVTATPRISKTKFLAFGDSITFGRCGSKDAVPNTCPPYTVRLEELLRARYARQSFTFNVAGNPGERAEEGEDRLVSELNRYNPEVLLLMEGTNDMIASPITDEKALDSLDDMIVVAQGRGVSVIVATIPPIAPGGVYNAYVSGIAGFNSRLRSIAAARGVPVADVFALLSADIPRYYVGDDLHPVLAGLQAIGEAFYTAIRNTMDVTPATPGDGPNRFGPQIFNPPGPYRPISRQKLR